MCKATLPILGGQGLDGLLFDVVAFNREGERSQVVSAGVLLSGAIACARGFNAGRQIGLVAVVLPASSNENSGRDSREVSPAAGQSDTDAQ